MGNVAVVLVLVGDLVGLEGDLRAKHGQIKADVHALLRSGFYGTAADFHQQLKAAGKDYFYKSVWFALRALHFEQDIKVTKQGHYVVYGGEH